MKNLEEDNEMKKIGTILILESFFRYSSQNVIISKLILKSLYCLIFH